ncbi:hypothetical protein NLI96_g10394 [Meripilus lineatus]|uniref:FAM192A/Fyv6 N-terminal domain-containing protein n=1 Tax=Meripilus lineatus TaxID=2056292 RepID=A0AAD5UTR8_9APHY|nr:hypothetical protein NLI96_g10394 [Physisporinus lineatus]
MDDIPSISSGSVGSRFVSQSELETAKARRDEQWKAAYARLGQEPPPQPVEDVFDGRSLAEVWKLAANKAAKQEEWEQRNKLGNQFRALEEDEVLFLDSVLEKQRQEEKERQESDGKELEGFRQAVAARENAAKPPPVTPSAPNNTTAKSKSSAPPPIIKKDTKKSLKGVLVKKKPKATTTAPAKKSGITTNDAHPEAPHPQPNGRNDEQDSEPPKAKRRRVEES